MTNEEAYDLGYTDFRNGCTINPFTPGSQLHGAYEDGVEAAAYDAALDYDESMDGDHESALASCGWGTDEDYGYYGGDEY